jgi:hypothetical protein
MLPAVEPVNLENAPALTNAFSSVELRASERRRSSGLLCRARKAFRLWATRLSSLVIFGTSITISS